LGGGKCALTIRVFLSEEKPPAGKDQPSPDDNEMYNEKWQAIPATESRGRGTKCEIGHLVEADSPFARVL
jgi:hypothetical protein